MVLYEGDPRAEGPVGPGALGSQDGQPQHEELGGQGRVEDVDTGD